MGWPLAVSAGLMEKSSRALVAALWPLTVGHLLAMLLVLLPFALLVTLVEWQRQIQIGASLLVIGFGIFRLLNRRHPRALARIRPTQLGLWSFAVAIAHGAGLMLVPIYLGLCRASDLDKGHQAAGALINFNLGMAVLTSVVHSASMITAASSCSGVGSIWRRAGPSASFWWERLHWRSASRPRSEVACGCKGGYRRHPTHQISASLFKVARKLKLRFPTRVVPNTSARSSAKVPENPLVTSCPANSGRTKRSANGVC